MHIAMIGTGYVGLVTGVCLAHLGHTVTCVDIDSQKIENLENGIMPIYEKGLRKLVEDCVTAERLFFSDSLENGIQKAQAVFICVGTPSLLDGSANLEYVFAVAESIAQHKKDPVVIVDKSTVPVGTADKVRALVKKVNPNLEFDVVSNPEFLREGVAIDDFLNPDRVVVGVENDLGKNTMIEVYNPLTNQGVELLVTDTKSAEMIKYATNAFLATKITFANDLADLCEKTGGNITDVTKGFGMDSRIGAKFLNPGPGYGGSCFPKDTRALVQTADSYGVDMDIIHTVVKTNEKRKKSMVEKISTALDGALDGKKIAVLGVTFKAGTDDMREAPSLTILPELLNKGATVTAYDPQGNISAPALLPDSVVWAENIPTCLEGSDAVVILTEWPEFSVLDMPLLQEKMRHPVIIDLRNLYDLATLEDKNVRYHSLGRHAVGRYDG